MPPLSEEQKTYKNIAVRVAKATRDYGLIEDGDKILVALSGGKDSLTLLQMLAERSRIHKPRITVVAAHVRMLNIPYKTDTTFLQEFCDSLGITLHLLDASFDASTDSRKSPCFLCSWNRRKALFELAQQQGCNKIALGHNMDDFLETMLMNITFQGAFSTMPPKLVMKKFDMTIIRPMCLVHETDLEEMAKIRGFRKQIKNCPYETQSNRTDMKGVLKQLETLNPEARYSLWGSMTNVQEELLPDKI